MWKTTAQRVLGGDSASRSTNTEAIQDGLLGPLLQSSTTPSKSRSFSDSTPALSPSPKFKEPAQKWKDDSLILATPSRGSARRVSSHGRSLSLQMPARDLSPFTGYSGLGAYSPHRENRDTYTSPSSVLPRHSRGLDFARACTNLHHSTLADQSSPDASPTVTQKNFNASSRRGSTAAMAIDSPRAMSISGWSGGGNNDRLFKPRSVGSTNGFPSDVSSSSSDDDDQLMRDDDFDDPILTTPQVHRYDSRNAITPYNSQRPASTGWLQSPLNSSVTKTQAPRPSWRMNRSSSSGASLSTRNIRKDSLSGTEDFNKNSLSRQESLSLGTNSLHITSSNESSEAAPQPSTPSTTHGVVRRPVTRRSNLLPKSKNFVRIRALLQEETTPADSEARREAEVVRQVRDNEFGAELNQTLTAPSSPNFTLKGPTLGNESSDMSDVDALGLFSTSDYQPKVAADSRRSSSNKEFFSNLYNNFHNNVTPNPPQPPLFYRTRSSSGVSEDIGMESPRLSTPPSSLFSNISAQASEAKFDTDSSQSAQFQPPNMPSAIDISRKVNKRRRDEDLDGASIKRRAVSPGFSVQNSPVTGQSPVSNGGLWGQLKANRDSTVEDRSSSSGSIGHATPNLGPKRVGLQGMTDTNDGLMKMSID